MRLLRTALLALVAGLLYNTQAQAAYPLSILGHQYCPVPAGTYLDDTAVPAPQAINYMIKVERAYTGPLFRLSRTSDNVEQDFWPKCGSVAPDYTAIDTWAAGSTVKMVYIYDQVGQNVEFSPNSLASAPWFNTNYKDHGLVPATMFAEAAGSGQTFMPVSRLAVTRTAVSVFTTVNPLVTPMNFAANDPNGLLTLTVTPSGSASLKEGVKTRGTNDGGNGDGAFMWLSAGVVKVATAPLLTQLQTLGFTTNTTNVDLYYNNGTHDTFAQAISSQLYDKIYQVSPGITDAQFGGSGNYLGQAVWNSTLSSGNAALFVSTINTLAGISAPNPNYNLVIEGDSINVTLNNCCGGTTTGTVFPGGNQNPVNQAALTQPVTIYNLSSSGTTLQSDAANTAIWMQASGVPYKNGSLAAGKNILFIPKGINDLFANARSAILVEGDMTTIVTAAHTAGFVVIVQSILPNLGTAYSAGKDAVRVTYNTWLTGNTVGADYVCDLNVIDTTIMNASAPNGSLFQPDHAHPSSTGIARLGADMNTCLAGYLGATP